jgi:hypothetical protein
MLTTIRDNPERAAFIGLNVRAYQLAAFVVAGGFAGLAGALYGLFSRGVFADYVFWAKSAKVIIMTILGGMHFFWGPPVGALALVWLNQQITEYTEYWPFVLGTVLLVLLFLFPGGIVGGIVTGFRLAQRQIARSDAWIAGCCGRSLGGEVDGDERPRRRFPDICGRGGSFFLDLGEQPGLNRGGCPLSLRIIAGETAGLEDCGAQLGDAAAASVIEMHQRKAGPGHRILQERDHRCGRQAMFAAQMQKSTDKAVAAVSVLITAARPVAVVGKKLEHEIEQLHRFAISASGIGLIAPDPRNGNSAYHGPSQSASRSLKARQRNQKHDPDLSVEIIRQTHREPSG